MLLGFTIFMQIEDDPDYIFDPVDKLERVQWRATK